ncbi:MAG: 3-oxoacyl-[acyl-carrier-protein] synthase III [Gammaproteobacteria bacterium]|jgi:3-oxoacyl-[acyl-carrier-protein] synthase III
MKYTRVHMESIGYELPPVVITSDDLESRLMPMYDALHIAPGQLEALTGITERRWWEEGHMLSDGAAAAARKALEQSNVKADEIEALIYTGVCRENFEPATACAVAAQLGIKDDANIYDISNACLGVMNGIIDIANRIELKQIRAGMVVSCETSREIVEIMIERMLNDKTMEMFSRSLATLTGGSGAAAVLLTDGSFDNSQTHRLLGGANQSAPEHHKLCRWGVTLSPVALGQLMFSPDKLLAAIDQVMEPGALPSVVKDIMTSGKIPPSLANMMPSQKLPEALSEFMSTDSVAVLKHGAKLGVKTWGSFLGKMGWARDQVDKVICHQVGEGHRDTILKELGIDPAKDFSTYKYLGNIGTVSVPLTAAIAEQRLFLKPGDRVSFLGIGSGLNCMMLGWEW